MIVLPPGRAMYPQSTSPESGITAETMGSNARFSAARARR